MWPADSWGTLRPCGKSTGGSMPMMTLKQSRASALWNSGPQNEPRGPSEPTLESLLFCHPLACREKPVSLQGVFDKAVKSTDFIKPLLLRAWLFTFCVVKWAVHESLLHTNRPWSSWRKALCDWLSVSWMNPFQIFNGITLLIEITIERQTIVTWTLVLGRYHL